MRNDQITPDKNFLWINQIVLNFEVEIVVQMTLFVSLEREMHKRYYLQLHFYKYSLVVKNLNLGQVVNIDGQLKLTDGLKKCGRHGTTKQNWQSDIRQTCINCQYWHEETYFSDQRDVQFIPQSCFHFFETE